MSEYKALNDKQVQDIAQAYYDEYKKHVTPQEQPTLLKPLHCSIPDDCLLLKTGVVTS